MSGPSQFEDTGSSELTLKYPQITRKTWKFPRHGAKNKGRTVDLGMTTSLEPPLRSLFNLVQNSKFYLENRLEPTIGSEECDALLAQDSSIAALLNDQYEGKSIYTLFIEEVPIRCRLCGATRSTHPRILSCVRSHFDHRPFACPGAEGRCKKCNDARGYGRFFSQALLRDHITSQSVKVPCNYEGCSSVVRQRGMKKHWISLHKNQPYPTTLSSVKSDVKSVKSDPTAGYDVFRHAG